MNDEVESPLKSRSTQGIVRVENTVHRPLNENSEFTHSLLGLLEERNFPYSPRFHGIDEKGREVLDYIDGDIPRSASNLTESQMVQAAKILRMFHDVTEGTPMTGVDEVVCHNDYAPWNIVIKDDEVVGIIDFDDSAPGKRIDNFAYFLWTFLDLGSDMPVDAQASRIKVLCDAYGLEDRSSLFDAVLNQQVKILEKRKRLADEDITEEAREFSKQKVIQIEKEMEWVKTHRQQIQEYL